MTLAINITSKIIKNHVKCLVPYGAVTAEMALFRIGTGVNN